MALLCFLLPRPIPISTHKMALSQWGALGCIIPNGQPASGGESQSEFRAWFSQLSQTKSKIAFLKVVEQ